MDGRSPVRYDFPALYVS